jgi:threonine dehydrogenase-like Zn-dependent dehydrogenase
VVGSFWASDNTCELCQAGYQSACLHREPMGALGAQAELLRVPLADGTLVATPDLPADDLVPSLLAASDVLGTGWFAAVAAEAGLGKTVAVVGDGAVGLLAVLAARQLGAEQIIAMSRQAPPISLKNAATTGSRGSRSSLAGWGRTRSSRGRHPGVDAAGHRRHPPGWGMSASLASPTGWSCRSRGCSGPLCICTAARRRCAASCPSSST